MILTMVYDNMRELNNSIYFNQEVREMKNETICIKRSFCGRYMIFYYDFKDERSYLFAIPYSESVYQYFCKGRAVSELRKYNKWSKNKKLDHLIEHRIPYELKKRKEKGESKYAERRKRNALDYDYRKSGIDSRSFEKFDVG